MKRVWLCSASLALTVGSSLPSYAQTDSGLQLEEVVVTAEKREENLQKVPISIQVREGEDLRRTGKKRIDEIMQGTVGIQAQDSQVGVTFFVRGVDSGGMGPGTASAVPIIIDGVAQSRSEAVRGGTLDLAQAEIMRGPQSTTLGANALAGAISLISAKPVFNYEARGSLEFGNFHKRATEGVLNIPFSDNQALRIAYSTDKRLGYISSGAGDSDLTNARLKYRWQPNADIDLTATFSSNNIGGNGVQQGVLLATGHWQPWDSGAPQMGYYSGPTFTPDTGSCVPQSGTVMGCPGIFYVVNDGIDFRHRSNPWNDGYPANRWPNEPFRDTTIDQGSIELNWNTSIGTITFLPAYQSAHFRSQEPPRGTGYMAEDQLQDTVTGDLRLASPSGERLTWSGGLYYSHDKLHDALFANVDYPGTAPMGPGPNCASGTICYSYDIRNYVINTSINAFAEARFSIMDSLRLIGGLRYNNDKSEASIVCYPDGMGGCASLPGNAAGPLGSSFAASSDLVYPPGKWSDTTFRAGAEWDVLPEAMLYGVYSTGYNPGTLDTMSGSVTKKTTLEQVTVGLKSQWLDNRLQFNAELFNTKFHNRTVEGTLNSYVNTNSTNCFGAAFGPTVDVQLGMSGGYCAIIGQNSAQVKEFKSQGIDMDMTWVVTSNDRLNMTAEYLKSQYDTAPLVYGMDGNPVDVNAAIAAAATPLGLTQQQITDLQNATADNLNGLVGHQLQNAPKFSATLDYQHQFDLPGGSKLTPRVAAVYKSKYWSFGGAPGANVTQILADSNNPNNLAWQQSYTKWDLYLGWDTADSKFNINGYVKNVQNKAILANYTDPYVSLEAPRTYGVTFSGHF
jgi:iron complex outermembrane recepter protein